ncbi:DUF4349 domain-containing protein [Pseudactinotalea suaedae]|uniref:DUF4349 domain-containing protein n=1 Tax=Pseudactinotalea suaedae TaxID=1524924 RepID=UPI0012E32E75|nr:DUF4349 domain-containing protein [Pseudactinotalea suaedae]
MDATRTRAVLAAASLTLLALAGCSSGGGADGGGSDQGDSGQVGGDDGGVEEAAGDVDTPMSPIDGERREVIITADASVLVDDPREAAVELAALAAASGGHVESRQEHAGTGEHDPGWASLVLRIPSEELTGMIDDLADVGEVQSVSQSEEDVTSIAVDLDARIAALETSTDRLLEIMAGAETTEDLLATEKTLSERQADLESLQSQRAALSDRVAMSTLTVSLDSVPPSPAAARGGFLGGLESGWNALVSFVGSALVVLGALLPWLVAIGVPALLTVVFLRRRQRTPAATTGPSAAAPPDGA